MSGFLVKEGFCFSSPLVSRQFVFGGNQSDVSSGPDFAQLASQQALDAPFMDFSQFGEGGGGGGGGSTPHSPQPQLSSSTGSTQQLPRSPQPPTAISGASTSTTTPQTSGQSTVKPPETQEEAGTEKQGEVSIDVIDSTAVV